ncbi:glycosyltransferase family 2 protein [Spongisporangium articulatum]|uniref:Glycosyltransferase family 2 protein n=1 Tax=Spongisporangium articulatum TaxID=3362603 RepID=A0ABW8ANI2_9ACTN
MGFEGRLFVVIPAFNEVKGITRTLEALAAQGDRDFELVVVDNDSTDGTAELVRAFPGLSAHVIHEAQKGTGAAADTGMRAAIELGATHLARTDADCLPLPDWTAAVKRAFGEGLDLVSGQLLPRLDEPDVKRYQRWVLLGAVELASAVGKVRPGNRDPEYLGPYVMTPGCNMAITADLYLRAGGFPRTKIEDLHEDRALVNAVRKLTTAYGLRRYVRVRGSSRRVGAWGLRNTLAWYADHRYRPEHVDIR